VKNLLLILILGLAIGITVPNAHASITNSTFGEVTMLDAFDDLFTGFIDFKNKIIEIINQVNENTNTISEVKSKVDGLTTYNNTAVKTISGIVKDNIVAICDTGDVLTGGGHSVIPMDRTYIVLDAKPISNLTGYNVTIQSFTSAADYTAYAICLDLTP
jgi:TPP-dependent 2-oxoacid decarboxylase